jgi:hypothetical protein
MPRQSRREPRDSFWSSGATYYQRAGGRLTSESPKGVGSRSMLKPAPGAPRCWLLGVKLPSRRGVR